MLGLGTHFDQVQGKQRHKPLAHFKQQHIYFSPIDCT